MWKIILFKVALSVILGLLGLTALWFTLPFPATASPPLERLYIENTLRSGRRVTTVHCPGSSFFNTVDRVDLDKPHWVAPNFESGIYNAVILSWQLHRHDPTNTLNLEIGRNSSPDFGTLINLTDLALQAPGFLDRKVDLWAPAGDQDGFSPSYFDYADATMIYHDVFDTWQALRLRLLVSNHGTVQIWKNMPDWETFDASDIVSIDDVDRKQGLLAEFDFPNIRTESKLGLSSICIRYFGGLLPTRTYPLRYCIVVVLKTLVNCISSVVDFTEPVLLIIIQLLKYTITAVGIYGLISAVCWTILGRGRSFTRWAEDFWLTRDVCRWIRGPPAPKIWTASGPMRYDDEERGRCGSDTGRIKPVRGFIGFFTSSSPLDSLLASFESTKWMTEPMPTS